MVLKTNGGKKKQTRKNRRDEFLGQMHHFDKQLLLCRRVRMSES